GGAARAARRAVTSPRFHVPEAGPGGRVSLPEHAAHHAREVLRLRAGAAVRIFDGAGAEFEAELDSVTRRGVEARIGHAVGAPPLAPLPRPPAAALLLIGPAGGWEPRETERLTGAGFAPASLGPRILRSETAALAAVVAAQVLWGDLGRSGA